MPRNDIAYLRHILDAIIRIEDYLQGIAEADFHKRYLIQDGVIRQIEIIGEATKQLSKETRENNSHISWRDIAGMRDKLTHHYFGVDMEELWLTAQDDLPTPSAKTQFLSALSYIRKDKPSAAINFRDRAEKTCEGLRIFRNPEELYLFRTLLPRSDHVAVPIFL